MQLRTAHCNKQIWLLHNFSHFTTLLHKQNRPTQLVHCSKFQYFLSFWAITLNMHLICNRAHKKSSAVAEMGDRGHNRHGPKRGGLLCPFRGSWDPAWAEVYFSTKRRLHPSSHLATIGMDQKLGGVGVPFFWEWNRNGPKIGERAPPPLWGGGLGPHLTQSPGLRPTFVPSGILIHPPF